MWHFGFDNLWWKRADWATYICCIKIRKLSLWSLSLFISLCNLSWLGISLFIKDYNVLLIIIIITIVTLFIEMTHSEDRFLLVSMLIISVLFMTHSNLFIIYFIFELRILPVLIILLLGGMQIEKVKASYYLISYGLLFSIPFLWFIMEVNLLGVLIVNVKVSYWLILMLLSIFFMKLPLFFFHHWLPKVHVEASTPASILLAAVLLKFGGVGLILFLKWFIRICWLIIIISLLGIVISSLLCTIQSDMKSFLAYSSVSHMCFLSLSLMLVSSITKYSSIIIIIGHGWVSGGTFFLIGELYHNNQTRLFFWIKGLFGSRWLLTLTWSLLFWLNLGVPPTLGFFSEVFGFIGMLLTHSWLWLRLFGYFMLAFMYTLYVNMISYVGKYSLKSNSYLIFSIQFLIVIRMLFIMLL